MNMRLLVRSPARPIFFPRINDSHCDRIHFSLITVRCFDNGYVGKQPMAWKEYCTEYLLKELQESMDRWTGRRDITELLLKTVLNTINRSINCNHKFIELVLSSNRPVAWKEYCAEYWLKGPQESMDRCTGRRDITELQLKTALNTINQSINRL